MWVRFTEEFTWYPHPNRSRVQLTYKPGWERNVTTRCGNAAIRAKKAVKIDGQGRD